MHPYEELWRNRLARHTSVIGLSGITQMMPFD